MTCQPSAVRPLRLIFTGIVAFLLPYLFTGEALSAFSVCALVLRPLAPGLSPFYQLKVSSYFCAPRQYWLCCLEVLQDGYRWIQQWEGRFDTELSTSQWTLQAVSMYEHMPAVPGAIKQYCRGPMLLNFGESQMGMQLLGRFFPQRRLYFSQFMV